MPHVDFPAVSTVYRGAGPIAGDPRASMPAFRVQRGSSLLEVNRSRAVPPAHLELSEQGMLISPEVAQLIGLHSSGERAPVFTLPTPVDPNVPLAHRHYMVMVVEDLLMEVGQCALGAGPPDAVPARNPDVRIETRRFGDIWYALSFQPGREHDLQLLFNAGWALEPFWPALRELRDAVLASKPHLAPVVGRWIDRLAQAAVDHALGLPLGDDGLAQKAPDLSAPIVAVVQHPLQHYVPELEWRLVVLKQDRLEQFLRAFFERVSKSSPPGAALVNTVVGARKNLIGGPGLDKLLDGSIVFVCTQAQLVENLRTIPAGVVQSSGMPPARMPDAILLPRYAIAYPWAKSGTTIDEVYWRDETGEERRVLVALRNGVHSFLIEGRTDWAPTGADGAEPLQRMRIEGWRSFLAERWNDYNKAQRLAWPDVDPAPQVLPHGDTFFE